MAALTLNTIRFCTLALGLALALAPPALAGDVSVKLDAGTGLSVKNNTGAIERLRVDEATGNISRNGALFVHTTGSSTFLGQGAGNLSATGTYNSAFGAGALQSNKTGFYNSAFGVQALWNNYTGSRNAAFGRGALRLNFNGRYNAAFGEASLENNRGDFNTAVGRGALFYNTASSSNTAVGHYALLNSTGQNNIAVGKNAGMNVTTGSNNIEIGHAGSNGDLSTIRIGTVGTHFATMIAGIHGRSAGVGAIAVLISSNGTLGTIASSARFKQDVRDMDEASDVLMKLRPVTFRYREDAVGAEESRVEQYGLIAEEVAEVAPELVATDLEGRPYSVKYHELPAMLLNEMQEQQRTIEKQAGMIEAQRQEYAKQIAALTTRLARLEAHAR